MGAGCFLISTISLFQGIISKISDGGDRTSEATIINLTWISQPVLDAELQLDAEWNHLEHCFIYITLMAIITNILLSVH